MKEEILECCLSEDNAIVLMDYADARGEEGAALISLVESEGYPAVLELISDFIKEAKATALAAL